MSPLHGFAAAYKDLGHELGREEAVLDNARSGGQASGEDLRIVDRPDPVGEHASVWSWRSASQLHVSEGVKRGGESELEELERNRG